MFGGEFIGMMNSLITYITKSSLIGRAKNRGFFFGANITLDLHDLI